MAEVERRYNVALRYINDKSLSADFPMKPSLEEGLVVYGLFKQIELGDCASAQPWAFQVTQRAKWEAHNKHKGLSRQKAMEMYVNKILELTSKVDTSKLPERAQRVMGQFFSEIRGTGNDDTIADDAELSRAGAGAGAGAGASAGGGKGATATAAAAEDEDADADGVQVAHPASTAAAGDAGSSAGAADSHTPLRSSRAGAGAGAATPGSDMSVSHGGQPAGSHSHAAGAAADGSESDMDTTVTPARAVALAPGSSPGVSPIAAGTPGIAVQGAAELDDAKRAAVAPASSSKSALTPAHTKALSTQLLALQEENHQKLSVLESQLMRIVSRSLNTPAPASGEGSIRSSVLVRTPGADRPGQGAGGVPSFAAGTPGASVERLQQDLRVMLDRLEAQRLQKEADARQMESRWAQQLAQVEQLQNQLLQRLQNVSAAAGPGGSDALSSAKRPKPSSGSGAGTALVALAALGAAGYAGYRLYRRIQERR